MPGPHQFRRAPILASGRARIHVANRRASPDMARACAA